ncbi:patatin [Shewanella sp. 10N.286.51.B7]|uniref:patatin-like phospholipase family protein n=1 Tax=Shewanella sp. 10N.286.51.B7 TaxID=1880836 RepID=UPI000CAF0AA8|nr:patatin-like phospholipase family protein [Shewanella sp. 10N.286.51.B7]PMG77893.1 patatin [Shewanella sp. 10N.286.51.B7]
MGRKITLLMLLSIVLSMVISMAYAQERPSVGLVLSGGGAKGSAHIGVLKVLEKNRIPVDYVTGTSIGSYVGGMYALGYTATEIEDIMLNSPWAEGYSDTIPREDLSFRDKQHRDKFNIPINVGYKDGGLAAPSGLLRGQTMSQLLRDSTDLVEQFGDFDDLAIPFRAVATDLTTSHAVILAKGSIVKAMQASATVPGALQPAEIDGKLLVDGGISNNMPIDVIKAMGADVVIAIDIGSPLASKEELDSTIAVLEQLSTILTMATTQHQKTLLVEGDVLIRPAIDDMSTTDFEIMPQALEAGRIAGEAALPMLAHLGVSEKEYQQYQADKKQIKNRLVNQVNRPATQIVFVNDSKVSERLLREELNLKEGEVITKEALEAGVKRLYSLNKFERVDAEFEDTEEGRILTINTHAKSWGPNYFDVGFNWEDDFTLDSAITLSLAYTMGELTNNGGEWRNEVQLGYEKRISTEFYQPFSKDQDYYGRVHYEYEIKDWDFYDGNEREYELKNALHQFAVGVGYNYSHAGLIELGAVGEAGTLSNRAVSQIDLDYKSKGGYFMATFDTLNSISFPTEGQRLTFKASVRDEEYKGAIIEDSGELSWHYEADWKGALKLGNHAIVGKVELATVDVDREFTLHVSELGGFLNLSGYHKGALAGAHKAFGALIYQYDLGRDVLLSDVPLYLGTSFEGGNVWVNRDNVDLDDLIYAGSLYLGTDTSWGPAALGVGFTDTGEQAFYLFIGKNF